MLITQFVITFILFFTGVFGIFTNQKNVFVFITTLEFKKCKKRFFALLDRFLPALVHFTIIILGMIWLISTYKNLTPRFRELEIFLILLNIIGLVFEIVYLDLLLGLLDTFFSGSIQVYVYNEEWFVCQLNPLFELMFVFTILVMLCCKIYFQLSRYKKN